MNQLNIKLVQKRERIEDWNTKNKNIQSGYRDGIWHGKMCLADNEKRKKMNNKWKYVLGMETDYFDIVAGVLQGETLAPWLFIICLDYVPKTSIDKIKENGFKLTKEISRRYPAKTITDTDFTDDIALLANAPAQAETLPHSLERVAAGICVHVNAHKTEYMCFNQTGDISTLNGSFSATSWQVHLPRKQCLINRKRHRHVTSKSMDSNNSQSVIWKLDLTDKMKRSFFQAVVVSMLLYRCATWTPIKRMEKNMTATTQECCEQ